MVVLTRQGLMLVVNNNGSAHRQNLVDKNNSNELSHAFLTGTGGEKL